MNRLILYSFLFLSSIASARQINPNAATLGSSVSGHLASFTENKGHLSDQHGAQRRDILCYGSDGSVNYYLKNDGVSYQLVSDLYPANRHMKSKREQNDDLESSTVLIQRIDINWLNANSSANISFGNELPAYINYYSPHAPEGITKVKAYGTVSYQNLYNGIDLKYYYSDAGVLEYDFIVNPGADVSVIKMEVNGSTTVSLNEKGEVVIVTPTGTIIQGQPIVSQDGKRIAAEWILSNNVLSYAIAPYDHTKPLIIDPVVVSYGSYFGGREVAGRQIAKDKYGNIYMSGYANGVYVDIVTTGVYQDTVTGMTDAFVAKFDAALALQWCTYYGADSGDVAEGCGVDSAANVYIAGRTRSPVGMATPGAHKAACLTCSAGSHDGFIAKFSGTGALMWSTYVGGDESDGVGACTVDKEGDVYAMGATNSPMDIATPGTFQTVMSPGGCAFINKFNSLGVRQWGTYYGPPTSGVFQIFGMALEANGSVFVTGETNVAGAATAGAFQSAYPGGDYSALLTKFSPLGARMWTTYYGSASAADINRSTRGTACATDGAGNVYMTGWSSATGVPVSPGAFQPTNAGSEDGVLTKFDASGNFLWGTYFGGAQSDEPIQAHVDSMGNIFIVGQTFSPTGVATPDAHQSACDSCDDNFLSDAFLNIFDPSGARLYGTYYGGAGQDAAFSCVVNAASKTIYMMGLSTSKTGIATSGAATGACFSCANWVAPFLVRFNYTGLTSNPGIIDPGVAVVYPNPTDDKVKVANENPSVIKVFNALGILVATSVNTNTVSLKSLPSGMYYIQLIDDHAQIYKTAHVLKQ